jgi:lysophospholipase L1-like esterase
MYKLPFNMSSSIKSVKIIFSLSVLLLLHSQVSYGQSDPTVVSLFGDSISLGYNQNYVATYCSGDPICPGDRFGYAKINLGQPSVSLSALLNNSGRKSLVSNLGVGGSSSGPSQDPDNQNPNHGLSRITSNLQFVKSTYGNGDQFVLIMYGTNDYAYDIGPSTSGFNIQQIIQKSIDEDVTPIVGSIPPCRCQDVRPVNSQIRSAALRSYSRPVYYVDHYQNIIDIGWPSLLDPDEVHPNDTGYQAIAEAWFNTHLKNLIKPSTNVVPFLTPLLME